MAHDNGPREHLAISGDGFDDQNSGGDVGGGVASIQWVESRYKQCTG